MKKKEHLATTHPELAKEAHGWDPTKIIAGTHQKLEWKCKIGHVWVSSGNNRISYKTGCPYCANKKVLAGFNDLATTHPELAKEAHGWDPTKVVAGTHQKLEWKCLLGHIYFTKSVERVSRNCNCPYCANKKVLAGFNDLATTHPELAKEAHGWDPTKIIAGSKKNLSWICKDGHIWFASGHSRVTSESNCPICSNHEVLAGFNDLATTYPELAKEAHGWDPTKVVAGSDKKKDWKCEFGHKWTATLGSRKNGTGCPSCSVTGFDPNKSGYFYFLIQPKWEMYQIGITNFPNERLKSHSKNGFDLIELRGPLDGRTAQELETAIIRYLKSQKADLSPEHIAGKFDGYSESWTIESFKVNNLKELIDKASEAGF